MVRILSFLSRFFTRAPYWSVVDRRGRSRDLHQYLLYLVLNIVDCLHKAEKLRSEQFLLNQREI